MICRSLLLLVTPLHLSLDETRVLFESDKGIRTMRPRLLSSSLLLGMPQVRPYSSVMVVYASKGQIRV
jgi:hypothetical protein